MTHSETNFELGKPPIIEGWVRGTYLPPQDGSKWDWGAAVEFLESFEEELPVRERLPEFTPIATNLKEDELPDQFEIEIRVQPKYVRVRTESRSKVVQVGENALFVSQLRDSELGHPGFTPLKDLFLDADARYRDALSPLKLRSLELHYVDLVKIPATDEIVNLRDYFEGAPELGDIPYGLTVDVSWSFTFSSPDGNGNAQLAITMLPPDDGELHFRLDWHRWCPEIPDSADSVAKTLRMAHTYLKSCFRAICRPVLWELFDPQ